MVKNAAAISTTNLQLDCEFAAAEWKRIFVDVLIRLMPEINPDAADEVADAEHLKSPHLSPGRIAEQYAEDERLKARNPVTKPYQT